MNNDSFWAFVLGGSSGLGLASAKALAKKNFNLFIVHRDGKIATKSFNEEIEKIKKEHLVDIITLNTNANTDQGKELIKITLLKFPKKTIKVFLHSIADGHIKSLFDGKDTLTEEELLYTAQSMGFSFLVWTQWLLKNSFFSENAKVFGFTSAGSHRVIPGYAAVGTAKAILETLCKYMAVELAPYHISVNLLCPGVVKTKAIRVFPEIDKFINQVEQKNPHKRLTTPEDVANLLSSLCSDEINWLTGEIIHIDGGESNVF